MKFPDNDSMSTNSLAVLIIEAFGYTKKESWRLARRERRFIRKCRGQHFPP